MILDELSLEVRVLNLNFELITKTKISLLKYAYNIILKFVYISFRP